MHFARTLRETSVGQLVASALPFLSVEDSFSDNTLWNVDVKEKCRGRRVSWEAKPLKNISFCILCNAMIQTDYSSLSQVNLQPKNKLMTIV